MATLIKRGSLESNDNIPDMDKATLKEQQAYNRKQIYEKGFIIQAVAAQTIEQPLQLGGSPRKFWGIILFVPTANVNDDDIISLSVNEEIIIDKVNWKSYSPASSGNTFKPGEYYTLKRALSGNDSVLFTIKSVNSHAVYLTTYLSQA